VIPPRKVSEAMQINNTLLVCCSLILFFGSPADAGENPLGQVISLLDSLIVKITKEGESESKAYYEFVEWCDDASKDKDFEIKTLYSKKVSFEAVIGKATSDAAAAYTRIEELISSISSSESDLASATTIRKTEFSDFQESETELVECIDTCSRAITIVSRQMQYNPAALTQVDSSSVSTMVQSLSAIVDAASFSLADQQRLASLVQAGSDADGDGLGAPAGAVYQSHSTSIVEVLEDLKEKAEGRLVELRKTESSAQHNFELLKVSLTDQIFACKKELEEQRSYKASAEETKATAEEDLQVTIKLLVDVKIALQTVRSDCVTSASDHESSSSDRKEELIVIGKAREILVECTSGAVTQTYSFLQGTSAIATRLHSKSDLAKAEVVMLVRRLAKKHHSAALAQLASRIAAVERFGAPSGEDPFAKVKRLIYVMIAKLEAKASSEETEKAYCDKEINATGGKKVELEYTMSKLTSQIDKAAAYSVSLKEDVQYLLKELSYLAKSQAQLDKVRYESHHYYVQCKIDLEKGLQGVRKALSILRAFYSSGASAAMLQDGTDETASWEQPEQHYKATGSGKSIIGILVVVESDFAKNLASAEAEEADAQSEYEKVTQENSITVTVKKQAIKYSTQKYEGLDKFVTEYSSDRETTNIEFSAVLEYFIKIKERCIAKPETYEECKRRRDEEIAGLREALSILEDSTALTQRGKRSFKGRFLGM